MSQNNAPVLPLYLGVDGGGSKTDALVVDATGMVVGQGRSGAGGYHSVGLETALSNIRVAAEAALNGCQAEVSCFCLSGADMPHNFAQLLPGLEKLQLGKRTTLFNDVIAVFRAGSRYPYGLGVVLGTGFNAGGIGKNRQEFRLPALGPVTGDFASGGYYLGSHAIGLAFRAWDGRGEPTLLQEAVLNALDAPDMETLAERYVQSKLDFAQITGLAPLVFEVARVGDAVAQSLIQEQGREIGLTINTILRRLDLLDEPCDAVLGGSVFYGKGDLLLDTIRAIVQPVAPKVTLRRLDVAPVVGAVLLAYEHAENSADEGFVCTLENTLPGTLQVPGKV